MAGALASLQARQRTQVLHLLQVVVVLALAGKVFSCLVVTAPGATACMSQRRTTRSTPEHCVACALSADAHGGHPLPVPLLLREFHPTTRWWCEGWRTATCPVLCRSLTVSSDCGCAVAPCALVMRQTGGQRLPTQDCLLTRAYNSEIDTEHLLLLLGQARRSTPSVGHPGPVVARVQRDQDGGDEGVEGHGAQD